MSSEDVNPLNAVGSDPRVHKGHSEELDLSEIPDTDILFECPHCGKSLSIDQRGAGLVIRCTQCDNLVSVPIPDGMALDDFDASPEELSQQLLHARQTTAKAQTSLKAAEAEIAELREFKDQAMRIARSKHEIGDSIRALLARADVAQRDLADVIDELMDIVDAEFPSSSSDADSL